MSSLIVKRMSLLALGSMKNTQRLYLLRPQSKLFSYSALFRDLTPESGTSPTPPPPKPYNIRRSWSQADTEKLIKLVAKYGNKWKVYTSYFPGRTAYCIRSHYSSVTNDTTRWTLEEKKILQQSLGSQPDPDKIDWESVQSLLPKRRTIARIKQFYTSIHPTLNHGSWTKEETDQLKELVEKYGTKDWETIAKHIVTRSEFQCRNKWAYEATTSKKGEFSSEEDAELIKAVNKYGIDEFHEIKKEMNSKRSISQLRTRYNNYLNPDVDRSPWTPEEKKRAIELFSELKNISAVKKEMNSKRSIRDIYNQLRNK